MTHKLKFMSAETSSRFFFVFPSIDLSSLRSFQRKFAFSHFRHIIIYSLFLPYVYKQLRLRRLRKLGVNSEKSDESANQKRGALDTSSSNNNNLSAETSSEKDDNKNTIITGNISACLITPSANF